MNLDEVGATVSVTHAAALSRCMPAGSLVLERINPKTKYSEAEWLLLGILNSLREKPFDPFEVKPQRPHVSLGVEALKAHLALPRKEVGDGE